MKISKKAFRLCADRFGGVKPSLQLLERFGHLAYTDHFNSVLDANFKTFSNNRARRNFLKSWGGLLGTFHMVQNIVRTRV